MTADADPGTVEACASVMGALVGAHLALDDIALLMLRREPLGA